MEVPKLFMVPKSVSELFLLENVKPRIFFGRESKAPGPYSWPLLPWRFLVSAQVRS